MCTLAIALAVTAHLGLVGDYNSVHPSARCDFDNGVTIGVYYNSERAVSTFLGYRWEGPRFWAEAGLVTGYNDAPVIPFGRAGVKASDRVSIFIAPAYENWNGEDRVGVVVGTELKF